MPRGLGSVRVRTTLVAATAVGVAMVLGAWALVAILQRSLTEGVQSALELRLQGVVALARLGTLGSEPSLPGQPIALVQVVDPSGRVIAESSLLQDRPAIGPFRDAGTTIPARTARLTADDEQYRIVGTVTSTPTGQVTIYAAASLEAASDSVTRVKVALLIGLPLLLLIVAAACWWIVGRALSPVEAIRTEVAAIGSGRLDQRVPEPPVGDEIGRLARTMNEMLDRLQDASDRQRRFIADASHELRSPIASLRTQMEVQQTYSDNGGRLQDSLSSQLAEVDRMERLVSDLLTLARADERELAARVDRVSLHKIVLEEAARSVGVGRVRVDTSGVRPVTVLGDPKGLARVVRNLIENAARHARSRIEVTLGADGDHARLTVADDGPGIPAEAWERVFQRFTRLDESRARDEGGAGLGLAIAREIVAAHGGRIGIEDGSSGACFVVTLPLLSPPQRSSG
jgi:signal transduction histidine kinase